jgi:hypothetical protein
MELTTLVVVGTCSSRYTMTSADDYCKYVLHAEKPQNGLSEPVIRRTENTLKSIPRIKYDYRLVQIHGFHIR